jgi:hypothetical protein
MSILSDLFVPQTDFLHAHNDATFDARLSTLPTPPFEILNPRTRQRSGVQLFSISVDGLVGSLEGAPVGLGAGADQRLELAAEAGWGIETDLA